jgi:hypothetical protein
MPRKAGGQHEEVCRLHDVQRPYGRRRGNDREGMTDDEVMGKRNDNGVGSKWLLVQVGLSFYFILSN